MQKPLRCGFERAFGWLGKREPREQEDVQSRDKTVVCGVTGVGRWSGRGGQWHGESG